MYSVDDVPLRGGTGQVYLVDESGYYRVEVLYENGCVASSDEIRVCDPGTLKSRSS